jgi:hypothetical protein
MLWDQVEQQTFELEVLCAALHVLPATSTTVSLKSRTKMFYYGNRFPRAAQFCSVMVTISTTERFCSFFGSFSQHGALWSA